MASEWLGGKPAGCISKSESKYIQVTFPQSRKREKKMFLISDYSNENMAIFEAKKYRLEVSNEFGLTKNRYRYITETNGDFYLEVKLQKDMVMKCDVSHLPQVEERIWYGYKAVGKCNYLVKTRENKIQGQECCLFHRYVYPKVIKIDHINEDGFDNRSSNIRDGSIRDGSIRGNGNGKSSILFEDEPKALWRVKWIDLDGKKRSKSFVCAIHGEEAFNKASKWVADNHIEI